MSKDTNQAEELAKVRKTISKLLNVSEEKISNMDYLKKGMTNHSYRFKLNNNDYIIRVPGEGTSRLINRQNEALVYETLEGLHMTDEILYISGEQGYKITKFWTDARNSDPFNNQDIEKSMQKLKELHDMDLQVPHTFDPFEEIKYYEALRKGKPSVYKDYEDVKAKVFGLKPFLDSLPKRHVLAHIDSVSDNFLIIENEEVRIIDWEYGAMQDPDFDIAMFAIYSLFSKEQSNFLINAYYPEGCSEETRTKIYAYMAVGGLLWSNWCEYKKTFGVDFGEYALGQYQYAKEYPALVNDYLKQHKN